jgi:hypothetical protein
LQLIADKTNAGNTFAGRSTRRLESLTKKQREKESKELYADVMKRFYEFTEDDLITIENVKVISFLNSGDNLSV